MHCTSLSCCMELLLLSSGTNQAAAGKMEPVSKSQNIIVPYFWTQGFLLFWSGVLIFFIIFLSLLLNILYSNRVFSQNYVWDFKLLHPVSIFPLIIYKKILTQCLSTHYYLQIKCRWYTGWVINWYGMNWSHDYCALIQKMFVLIYYWLISSEFFFTS